MYFREYPIEKYSIMRIGNGQMTLKIYLLCSKYINAIFLQDFNEGTKKIIVDGCKNTDFSAILTEVKNF